LAVFFNPQMVYEPNSSSQWEDMKKIENIEKYLKNRFILSAEPQVGKTGTYLHFIELLCLHSQKLEVNFNSTFQKLLHKLKCYPPDILHKKLKTDSKEKQEWIDFHKLQDNRFRKMDENDVPFRRAINFIKQNIVVADMGCGSCQLAICLKELNPHICVINVDHTKHPDVPKEFEVIECNFAKTTLPSDSINVVVFSMSFSWGAKEEDFRLYIKEASRICKPGGFIFITEHSAWWKKIDLHAVLTERGISDSLTKPEYSDQESQQGYIALYLIKQEKEIKIKF